MTKHEAIQIILDDTKKHRTSLNYAVNYCVMAMSMPEGSEDLRVQILYILNNITGWRHPQAKEVRRILRS